MHGALNPTHVHFQIFPAGLTHYWYGKWGVYLAVGSNQSRGIIQAT